MAGQQDPQAQAAKAQRKGEQGAAESFQARAAERLQARVVYETVRREGEKELQRPWRSLWWSGLAAGICLSASVMGQGILRAELPHFEGKEAIIKLGYILGFGIVILGRLQLFTENTITATLPIFKKFTLGKLRSVAKLWTVVFFANIVGTFLAAWLSAKGGIFVPEHEEAFIAVSRPLLDIGFFEAFRLGIPAGFLIAALVWLLPNSKGFEIWVVALIVYFIGLGQFTHVIASSTEIFLLFFSGEIGLTDGLFKIVLPSLLGNTVGGTVLFAFLAYAQVQQEI